MSKTILFIHGLWMTPLCWDKFSDFFQSRGYTCHAPSWPHLDRSVEELRHNPPPELGKLGIPEIVAHYERIIRDLPEPPIIIGHSFGGLFTQILVDRGLGSAAVAINSAGPKGVLPFYWSAIRCTAPILFTPNGWNKFIPQTFEGFRYGFVNTMPEVEARQIYDTYCIPAVGRLIFQVATALLHNLTYVNFANNTRVPLLLTAGSEDHACPAPQIRANFNRYRGVLSSAITEYKEFPGHTHFLIGEPGWEEVAGFIATWLTEVQIKG